MRRLKPLGVLILIPAVCLLFSAPGCGKKEEPAPKASDKQAKDKDKKKPVELTELESTGWGKLSGTVTYDGDPPPIKNIDMSKSTDDKKCHDTKDERQIEVQTWLVDKKSKGVSDVIIFLKPPTGKYFKIHESYRMKAAKEPVLLHQPHCVFIPHSFVYWASYYDKDTKDLKPSGQKVKVLNDAHFNHNTAWSGDEDINPKGNFTLAPGESRPLEFTAQDKRLTFKCDIHTWMYANCWALDHPYAAHTDKDGNFTIENVPTGVDLYVVGWHEGAGFFHGGEAGKLTKFGEKIDPLKLTIKK